MRLATVILASLPLFLACPPAQAFGPQRIGITVGALDNPFYQALTRGAIQAAHSLNPSVQVTSLSANFNLPRQREQMRQLIEQKPDLILLGAVDSRAIAPQVRAARAAGIVVVAVDVDAPGADGTVKSDNRQAGEISCRHLAQQLRGKGALLIQGGPPVSSVSDRIAGCRAALAAFPGIRVLNGVNGQSSSLGGQRALQSDLARFAAIDAVFATNDRQALGCAKALPPQESGRVRIASVDGSPDIERALRLPGPIIASASQSPYLIGREAVLLGQRLRQGQQTARMVLVPVTLVTRDNLAAYRGWQSPLPSAGSR
ncbi:substrate-binding domain-containing protein [Chromobacterium amazonense]|uniref:substrate-binding domain-containing protein n=2 Tax=Chromobacterium amazonense TaxID=1382803 RepID=UPI0021B7BAFD|nr:substrate-binding domain-containing protein [Chromobacterium amazonense]MBM2885727.1 substrate-binding domain-containing protein [Chromobacterium amazonense]